MSIEHSSETVITDCTDSRTKVITVTVWWHFIDLYCMLSHTNVKGIHVHITVQSSTIILFRSTVDYHLIKV